MRQGNGRSFNCAKDSRQDLSICYGQVTALFQYGLFLKEFKKWVTSCYHVLTEKRVSDISDL
jgi:hypothetical protein